MANNNADNLVTEIEKTKEQVIDGGIEVIDNTNDRPAVQLVNVIFNQAVESRASDVHIEPYEKELEFVLESMVCYMKS